MFVSCARLSLRLLLLLLGLMVVSGLAAQNESAESSADYVFWSGDDLSPGAAGI
ncbi:MAG: hypothetical protein M5U34_35730 [Chloroflexi bacterium]|nr:hypothetical protein [Chloroflexota bacterium]